MPKERARLSISRIPVGAEGLSSSGRVSFRSTFHHDDVPKFRLKLSVSEAPALLLAYAVAAHPEAHRLLLNPCSTARPDPPDANVRHAIHVRDDVLLAASEALAEQATKEHFAKSYELILARRLPRPDVFVKDADSCMYMPTNCSTQVLNGHNYRTNCILHHTIGVPIPDAARFRVVQFQSVVGSTRASPYCLSTYTGGWFAFQDVPKLINSGSIASIVEIAALHPDIGNSSSVFVVKCTWRGSLLGSVEMQLTCGYWEPYFQWEAAREAMNTDIFATSQESVHCSACVQNFCQELIYLGSYTGGHEIVLPVLSPGKGFKFRMLNEDESRAVLLVFANKQDLPNAMNDAEITDKLGLYSLCQRHWYIENTCAAAVYSYGLAMEEDLPDAAQCITLQRQEARATLQTQKHDGQAGGSMREFALRRNSAEATTFFTNKEVQHNADCLSSTRSEQEFPQFPWDPGSNLQHRLGGKPSLKVGGMSGIIRAMGRHQAMGRVAYWAMSTAYTCS